MEVLFRLNTHELKSAWIAFYLVMVIIYLAIGTVFLFTAYFPVVSGIARVILGVIFVAYGIYRGYSVYQNYKSNR